MKDEGHLGHILAERVTYSQVPFSPHLLQELTSWQARNQKKTNNNAKNCLHKEGVV